MIEAKRWSDVINYKVYRILNINKILQNENNIKISKDQNLS